MMEHKFELEATEEITNAFATAMKLALTQPAKTAKATLRKALKEYPGYGQEPPAAP